MKLGVFTALFHDQSFEEMLDTVKKLGLDAVELNTGGFGSAPHCNTVELLGDSGKLRRFKKALEKRELMVSALSFHGNPLHPDASIAGKHTEDFRNTVLLAKELDIPCVNGFAGLPGGSEEDTMPNWVTCPWPPYFTEIINWQWKEKIIPYWRGEAAFAREHGVEKICFEMHPGDSVYSPEKLLKLRKAVGEEICCNFDPSHIFWQGVDPIAAIKEMGGSVIGHVHAKDNQINPSVAAVHGVLDTKPYTEYAHRSWTFRTVGYGHPASFWKDFVSALRLVGYDYVLSIEHEDPLMSPMEGLKKGIAFLRQIMLHEKSGALWWG